MLHAGAAQLLLHTEPRQGHGQGQRQGQDRLPPPPTSTARDGDKGAQTATTPSTRQGQGWGRWPGPPQDTDTAPSTAPREGSAGHVPKGPGRGHHTPRLAWPRGEVPSRVWSGDIRTLAQCGEGHQTPACPSMVTLDPGPAQSSRQGPQGPCWTLDPWPGLAQLKHPQGSAYSKLWNVPAAPGQGQDPLQVPPW